MHLAQVLRKVHPLIGAPRGLTVGLQWEIEDDMRCHLQAVVLPTGGQQYRGRKTRKQYSMFSKHIFVFALSSYGKMLGRVGASHASFRCHNRRSDY